MNTADLAALSISAAMALSGRPRPVQRLAVFGGAGTAEIAAMPWLFGVMGIGAALVAARSVFPLALAACCAVVIGWRVRRGRLAARAREDCAAATVEVTFALVGELRAGRTPAQALAAVAVFAGPLRPVLDAAQLAVAVGASASDEFARAAAIPGAERLRYVAAAWSVADSAGGRVAIVLERLSEAMDSDEELRGELDAAIAGPRATMVLLAGLPLLGLGLGQSVGAHPLDLLVHRPLGWGLLTAAVVLDCLGVVATRAIARVALRP